MNWPLGDWARPDEPDDAPAHPYRGGPDIGWLISSGIRAMARGFAMIAEEAARQATENRARLRRLDRQLRIDMRHVPVDFDKLPLFKERLGDLKACLEQNIATRHPIVLHSHRDRTTYSLVLTAFVDYLPYEEHITLRDFGAAWTPDIALFEALNRLAVKIVKGQKR